MNKGCLTILILLLMYSVMDFAIAAGLIWVVCWAFDVVWSWKATIGVWILLFLISDRFRSKNTKGE